MVEAPDWYAALCDVVELGHVAGGDDLAWIVARAGSRVGMDVELYLADLPQRRLHPLRTDLAEPLDIDSTLAGRAFRLVEPLTTTDRTTGRPALWVPVLDGTARIGVISFVLPEGADAADRDLVARCWTLAGLIGHLCVTKFPQSDTLHRLTRPKPLAVTAELLWQLLPPRTFACRDLTVSAVVEYYDQAGGDGYDYTTQGTVGHVAVFDATGHDLQAGLVCSMALAATRRARRAGRSLRDIAHEADEILRANAAGSRFTTAVLAELRLDTGVLSYLNAGHPPPILLRGGKALKELPDGRRMPLGLQHLSAKPVVPGRERLEPGDRLLLYTDGITQARDEHGEEFGVERLTGLVERHCAAGLPAPETLRRISHAMLEHQQGILHDDATLLMMEWPTPPHPSLLPTSL
ncbi:serine/threonine-protein phosphatase [Prauserella sp. PE36]|nr:SpoIIE family protein phosphatase [Prauserella sp. PE36]RBM21163.1 serine/threonine-protein phosphatase [Prauserella sp. PE36]